MVPPQFSILMGLRQTLFMIAASVVDSSHVAVMSSGSLLCAACASCGGVGLGVEHVGGEPRVAASAPRVKLGTWDALWHSVDHVHRV